MTFLEDSLVINASKICVYITAVQLIENDPMTTQKYLSERWLSKRYLS